jgi:seryl-tRNA synthetase
VKEVGQKKNHDFELRSHGEWLEGITKRFQMSRKTSGAGFFFLKDKVAMLDFALQKFALDN